MKTIKKYSSRHKYYTISARLNHFEMIEFRKLQEKYKLSASELIKKLVFREVPLTIKKINFAVLENKK